MNRKGMNLHLPNDVCTIQIEILKIMNAMGHLNNASSLLGTTTPATERAP